MAHKYYLDLQPHLVPQYVLFEPETCDCKRVRHHWIYDQGMSIVCVECQECGTLYTYLEWCHFPERNRLP